MPDSLAIATAAQQMAEVNIGIEASQTLRGQFRGMTVVALQPSQQTLMENAQEEMSFAVSDQMGSGLSKRKFSNETRIRSQAMEQADAYLKRVPDLEKNAKLNNFVSTLVKSPHLTARQAMTQARQFSQDPTLQYASLGYAMSLMVQEKKKVRGSSAELDTKIESLDKAMKQMMAEQGPEIQSGLNISQTAGEFSSERLGNPEALRGFYRDSVLDYDNITSAYKNITENYGEEHFKESLEFLLKALGADLSAQGSSIDPLRLRKIVDDMFVVKVLGGVHEQTGKLVITLRSHYQQIECKSGQSLMYELLDFKDGKMPNSEQVFQVMIRLNINGDEHRVYFTQAFKELMRLIPEKAYHGDLTRRAKVMMALQEAVDRAIEEEEANLYP